MLPIFQGVFSGFEISEGRMDDVHERGEKVTRAVKPEGSSNEIW